jgi:hypothetical protein
VQAQGVGPFGFVAEGIEPEGLLAERDELLIVVRRWMVVAAASGSVRSGTSACGIG